MIHRRRSYLRCGYAIRETRGLVGCARDRDLMPTPTPPTITTTEEKGSLIDTGKPLLTTYLLFIIPPYGVCFPTCSFNPPSIIYHNSAFAILILISTIYLYLPTPLHSTPLHSNLPEPLEPPSPSPSRSQHDKSTAMNEIN